jgi:hypothetical protein
MATITYDNSSVRESAGAHICFVATGGRGPLAAFADRVLGSAASVADRRRTSQ